MTDIKAISLEGKAVLVTGGTTGIGRAIGINLAAQGARVFTFGRHRKELDDALHDMRQRGVADGMVADAAKADDIAKVFAKVDDVLGDLDILIANAALSGEGLADMTDEDWRNVIETNVSGYLACAREAALRMRKRRRGHIVLIGSISADNRGKDSSVYVASKAAIQGFAESFAKELARQNIRVSLIEPGSVGSDMQEETPEEQRAKIRKHEMLMAEDIADCTRYILTRPARTNLSAVRIIPRIQED